ncbi:uncharacterized protein LOC109705647 isoform X2 [Ananas comosus]|uniref:Uncharacterized protein LOC109705647 isoform X2 n=1 Tax=Ananas comosus TaxID=4615 RepID=A0A6P5EFE3_ANACO|nr:uncharacterized protein LOC109705647 isoform X2 [Ananas comosus]
MLAAAAQPHPLFSLLLLLPHVSLLRLPPPRPLVAAAAAKIRSHHHHHYRRRRRRIAPPRDHSTADDETALDEEDFAPGPATAPAEAEAEGVETGGGLKGSDVLRALQRAVAAKEASPCRGEEEAAASRARARPIWRRRARERPARRDSERLGRQDPGIGEASGRTAGAAILSLAPPLEEE